MKLNKMMARLIFPLNNNNDYIYTKSTSRTTAKIVKKHVSSLEKS